MAQYRTGSANLTNGSALVTGNSTLWSAEVSTGDIFTVVGQNVWYEVASVDSNTQITLSAVYAGSTVTSAAYAISRDFTSGLSLPYPQKGDIETASLIKRAFEIIDAQIAVQNLYTTSTTTSTSQSVIQSFSASTYGMAKIVVSAYDSVSGDRYVSELLVTHDGTTAVATEYGQVSTTAALATYDVDISSGSVRLLATPASTNSTTFKVITSLA